MNTDDYTVTSIDGNEMNIDDYEGHTEGPWRAEEQDREGSSSMVWTIYGPDHWIVMESDGCLRIDWNKQDALLAAAAPNLLQALIDERAEVKRLRKQVQAAHEWVQDYFDTPVRGLGGSVFADWIEYMKWEGNGGLKE